MNETMTKREQIAAMAMQGILGNSYWNEHGHFDLESVARSSVDYADALIAHLKRMTPRHTEYTLTPNRVEEMLAATIPGGSVADPQEIADAIREWFGYSSDDLEETPTSEDSSAVEADKDGWIPHKPGDPMPCEGGSRIRIRLRNGVVATTIYPEDLEWGEIPYHTDEEIIAWKPAE